MIVVVYMGIDLADQFRLPASLDNIRVIKDQDLSATFGFYGLNGP
jgi:hypothetical protein